MYQPLTTRKIKALPQIRTRLVPSKISVVKFLWRIEEEQRWLWKYILKDDAAISVCTRLSCLTISVSVSHSHDLGKQCLASSYELCLEWKGKQGISVLISWLYVHLFLKSTTLSIWLLFYLSPATFPIHSWHKITNPSSARLSLMPCLELEMSLL